MQSRIALFLVSLLLALALCSIPLFAADDAGYTIRSSVHEVRIAFAAADRGGHTIRTLRSTDVAVVDNGTIIRQFRSFGPASQSPLDIVILLDASDSVAAQIPEEVAEAKDFVEHAEWQERDRVSILSFGGLRPQLLCARNCHGEASRIKLSALRASGATPLYDALVKATDLLEQDRAPDSRPAMILFSDGADTISMYSLADAVQAAQNLQALIYSVNSRPPKASPGKGGAVLDYLATNTGGLSFAPGQNVKAVLRMVLDDLRSGYVLTYEPPEQAIGRHSIRILPVSDPRLRFRSRLAYGESSYE